MRPRPEAFASTRCAVLSALFLATAAILSISLPATPLSTKCPCARYARNSCGASLLGLPFLVLHPGAHMGRGVEAGLEQVVASLDAIHAEIPETGTRIALETTAGQGSSLGRTFEELAFILRGCREPERLCVCIDTAHLFAAGYELGDAEGIVRTFAQFEEVIGFNRLAAIHMNDSKTASRLARGPP